MVTQADRGRNQWRNKGRLRFPTNGLVLYAPLWNAELSGSPFNAWNIANGGVRSCTVTGATKVAQGRDFDGTDDFISIPDSDDWDSADFTLLIWTKQDAFAGDYWQREFIAHNTIGGTNIKWYFGHDGTTTIWGCWLPSAAAFEVLSDTWTLSAGVWYCIGVTRIGSAFTFYKDGVANGTATNSTAMQNVAQPLTIGWGEGTPKTYDGIIGDVWKYTRGLSAGEMQQIYLATKGRYV